MKTKYLDSQLSAYRLIDEKGVLSGNGKEQLRELEAIKQALNLHIVMSSFRIGDDVLIDKDYRTTVIDIDKDNGEITVFNYYKKGIFVVKENRVSLTISNLT